MERSARDKPLFPSREGIPGAGYREFHAIICELVLERAKTYVGRTRRKR